MPFFRAAADAAKAVWTLGGQLRKVYSESISPEQQHEDFVSTLKRLVVFGLWGAIVLYTESTPTIAESSALNGLSSYFGAKPLVEYPTGGEEVPNYSE